MAGFVVYLDAPDNSAEPPAELLNQVQEAIERVHGDWTVRFDYTLAPTSNAPVYVGVSVSGSGFLEDAAPTIEEVQRLITQVDTDNRIVVARTRHSTWAFA